MKVCILCATTSIVADFDTNDYVCVPCKHASWIQPDRKASA